ncbi:MAG: hypothetical protein HY044_04480 [Candidatus Woesebacteria bacterium]|nr:MAG: hypothetical protein HY044_04480 [Candidatus Woesebacteria bacterium]
MSFFYIQGKFVILYDPHGLRNRSDYPVNLVLNQEIIDREKFVNFLLSFFKNAKLSDRKVKIILGDSVVYQKSVSLNEGEREEQVKKFLDSLPFEPGQVSAKIYNGKTASVVFAINKSFVDSFLRAFEIFGVNVLYLSPLSIFGISKDILDIEDIREISRKDEIAKKVDFLNKESQRFSIGRIFQRIFSK